VNLRALSVILPMFLYASSCLFFISLYSGLLVGFFSFLFLFFFFPSHILRASSFSSLHGLLLHSNNFNHNTNNILLRTYRVSSFLVFQFFLPFTSYVFLVLYDSVFTISLAAFHVHPTPFPFSFACSFASFIVGVWQKKNHRASVFLKKVYVSTTSLYQCMCGV